MHIFRWPAVVILASVLFSCVDSLHEMPSADISGGYPVNVAAGVGDATKVSLNGLALTWDEGDVLAMLADTDDAPVVLTIYDVDAGLAQAKFKGTVDAEEQPTSCYFAYPSRITQISSQGDITFDYSQQDGSHSPFLYGFSAYSPDNMYVTLVHAGAMLRISNSIADLVSITVKGNASEVFSKVVCNAATDGLRLSDDAASEFTVSSSSAFGSEIFVAMPPVNFSKGFTLICETSSGIKTYKSFSSDGSASGGYDFSAHRGYICDISLSSSPVAIDAAASVQHTFDSGYLTGTAVYLTLGRSGVSDKIASWTAVLKDGNGETVRTFSSSDRPQNVQMTDSNDWPYLNPGNYTLSVTCAVHDDVYASDFPVSVPTPDIVDVYATTTYSVYEASGADAANNTGHSSDAIYDIKSEIKIAPALFSHPKYTSSTINYSTTGLSSGELALSAAGVHDPAFGDVAMARSAHTVTALLTFGGVGYSDSVTAHVTGLPYSYDFYNKSVSTLESAGWTCKDVTYSNTLSKCAIQRDGSDGYLISPFFYFPKSLQVAYSVQAQYYRAWASNPSGRKINLYVGAASSTSSPASTYNSHECPGNNNTGKSFGTPTGAVTMSASNPYLSLYHSNANVSAQVDYLCIYLLMLGYQ